MSFDDENSFVVTPAPGNSFIRLPPLILEPDEFTRVWHCNAPSDHGGCREDSPHIDSYACHVRYCYEMSQAQFIIWTEDREKARRRYQP